MHKIITDDEFFVELGDPKIHITLGVSEICDGKMNISITDNSMHAGTVLGKKDVAELIKNLEAYVKRADAIERRVKLEKAKNDIETLSRIPDEKLDDSAKKHLEEAKQLVEELGG